MKGHNTGYRFANSFIIQKFKDEKEKKSAAFHSHGATKQQGRTVRKSIIFKPEREAKASFGSDFRKKDAQIL